MATTSLGKHAISLVHSTKHMCEDIVTESNFTDIKSEVFLGTHSSFKTACVASHDNGVSFHSKDRIILKAKIMGLIIILLTLLHLKI